MIFSRIPPLVRLIAGNYKDIFEDAGIPFSILCLLIVMTCSGFPVLSLFVRYFATSPSVSELSRQLNKFDEKTMNRAMRRVAFSVLKRVRSSPDDWIFAIDTTSNVKRTKGLEGAGLWANSSQEIYYGQNMMMLCAVNIKNGDCIPINWKPCFKFDSEKPLETNHSLVVLLLNQIFEENWPKLPLVMDSWFDSAKLMKELEIIQVKFVIEMKSSRKPKTNPSPRCPKEKLQKIFSKLPRISFKTTTRETITPISKNWKHVRFCAAKNIWIGGAGEVPKQFMVAVTAVFNHPKESKAFGYYATNDLLRPSTWAWQMSRWRWNIEVCFRDLRQGLNWGKLQAKTPQAANFSWVMPIIILACIREKKPNKPILTVFEEMKLEETMNTLDFHANNPTSKQRESLRIRLLGTPANKKVRITAAEIPKLNNNLTKPLKVAA
jgi:hypothetical protein